MLIIETKATAAFSLLEQKYKADLDWKTILSIIVDVISTLLACGIFAKDLRNRVNNPKWFDTFRIKKVVVKRLLLEGKSLNSTLAIIAVLKTVAASSTPEEIEAIYTESVK